MKLSLQLNNYMWNKNSSKLGTTFREIAEAVDEWGGLKALQYRIICGQFAYGWDQLKDPECYTVLTFLAAYTKRVQLLALATPPHFRYPALLAKIISTLDILSNCRAWLGIGAGDYADEAEGFRFLTRG